MRRKPPKRRVSRVTRAHAGYFAGLLLVAAGIVLALGLGWGVCAGGLGVIAKFVWLYDVEEPAEDEGVPFR